MDRLVLGIVLGLYLAFPRLNRLRFIARDPILTGVPEVRKLPVQSTSRFLKALQLGQIPTIMRAMRERVWQAANVKWEVVTFGPGPADERPEELSADAEVCGRHRERIAQRRSSHGQQIGDHLRNVCAAMPPGVKLISGRVARLVPFSAVQEVHTQTLCSLCSLPSQELGETQIRALLRQVFYSSLRSERLLMEQLDYNQLSRSWAWRSTSRWQEPGAAESRSGAWVFCTLGVAQAEGHLSDEHFTLDDGDRLLGQPTEVSARGWSRRFPSFHGEKRTNEYKTEPRASRLDRHRGRTLGHANAGRWQNLASAVAWPFLMAAAAATAPAISAKVHSQPGPGWVRSK